jgi:thioredoxin 1
MLIRKFGAEWCGPCKRLQPVLDQIDAEYDNVDFELIDVDESPELAREYGVSGIPALFIYDDEGNQIDHIVGVTTRRAILEALGV